MSNIETFPRKLSTVVYLAKPVEQQWPDVVDLQTISQQFEGLSSAEAEERLCRILEALALWLQDTVDAHGAGQFAAMAEPARRIASAADQIGLCEVVRAAGHVMICLHQNDRVALAAVVARLERAFDIAVTSVWDNVAF